MMALWRWTCAKQKKDSFRIILDLWNTLYCVRLQVLMAASMKTTFQGPDDGGSTSETSVSFYETTRRNIPEDRHLLTQYVHFDSSSQSSSRSSTVLSGYNAVVYTADSDWIFSSINATVLPRYNTVVYTAGLSCSPFLLKRFWEKIWMLLLQTSHCRRLSHSNKPVLTSNTASGVSQKSQGTTPSVRAKRMLTG
jgi:hypothetical protein